MSNVTIWKYKTVSRDEFETRKEFVEQIMLRLGAEPTKYGKSIPASRTIYKHKHEYYRVDEILIWEKPYLVIEWTDRLDFITDGIDIMEDIAPFPYDLSDEQIAIDDKKARLEKEISRLEKQARNEKQPKKKFELVQLINKHKQELVSLT